MASRSICCNCRIIWVLFCFMFFCLGPTVNHRTIGTRDNAAAFRPGPTQLEQQDQQHPGTTWGMPRDTRVNSHQHKNNDEDKINSNYKSSQYGNNIHDNHAQRDDKRKQQCLHNKDLITRKEYFTISEKLSNNRIQDLSEFWGELKMSSNETILSHRKFDEKGGCSRKFKSKQYKHGQNYDLHAQLLEAWERKEGPDRIKNIIKTDKKEVCMDECSAVPAYIPPELPPGCTQPSMDTIVCTNITSVPKFSDDYRHIVTVRFVNTNIKSFDAIDSCNLPPRTSTLVFDTSPLTVFDGTKIHCRNVERLTLEKSKIASLELFLMFSPKETSIKYLSLRSNAITYPAGVGNAKYSTSSEATLPSLETLILSDNQLITLDYLLFYPIRKSPVKHILLKNCSLQYFYGRPFNYTQNLEAVDISDNKLLSDKSLAKLLQPLYGRNLSILHSTHNMYEEPPFDALKTISSSLKELFLNNSAFHCLDKGSFPLMPKLEILAIGLSKIDMIHDGTFDGMPSLKKLYLEGNMLKTIPAAVLLPTLQILTFDNQNIDHQGKFLLDSVDFEKVNNLEYLSLNNIPVREIKEVTFLGLHNLKSLKLNGAQISSIAKESFSNSKMLTELYMNDNYIENLPANTFRGLCDLQYLEIQNNCLSFITITKYYPEISSLLKFENPQPLVAWLKGIKRRLMNDSTVEVDKYDSNNIPYSSPFSEQINLTRLDLSRNYIRYIFEDLFVDMKSLKYLNLNHNHIDEWDDHLFENSKSLSKLFLYGNKINTITEGMEKSLDNISYIDLRDNDFDCDCSLQYLYHLNNSRFYRRDKHQYELHKSRFYGSDDYLCKDEPVNNGNPYKKIVDYLSDNICENSQSESLSRNLLAKIMVPLLVCLTLIVVAVAGYKKRWYVLYVMHKFRNHSRDYQEHVKSSKYIYDIFVCYASSDRQWIFEQLIPKLENNQRLRVCVHERDFTVGQEITDNIVDSIDISRKVIVVLSPAFVKSSWCMFELKIANSTTVKTRESKLIFILLEHIQDDLMPKTLGVLLKTRTYIPWFLDIDSQKLFWARITRAVAKPSETETRVDYTKL